MSGVPEMLASRALEAVPSGIAVADGTTEGLPLVYVNPAFERLMGVPASRALGRPCAQALSGAPGPRALEALGAGETWRDARPGRRADGTPTEIELALAPVRDGAGRLAQVVVVVDDVGARAAPAGHPDDRLRVVNETARAFREEREFDCEFRMVAADGRELRVWERDTIVRDREGRPMLTQGVLVDVTSLRAAEQALRAEHERAQSYLDVAGAIMLALDRDGRVAMLNRAGHELLGYRDGELVGTDWFDTCLPAADRAEARASFAQVMAG